jgi:hypothetical protein
MTKTYYVVLSVKEINRLARAARRDQKAHHSKASHHTVSLYFAHVPDHAVCGAEQLSSVSFSASVDAIERSAVGREALDNAHPTL